MNACTKFHAVRTHGLGDRGLEVKYLYFAGFQEIWSEILRVNWGAGNQSRWLGERTLLLGAIQHLSLDLLLDAR